MRSKKTKSVLEPMVQKPTSPKTRMYTMPEKNSSLHFGPGIGVGSTFQDHGRIMRITVVGQVYRDGRERLIDITAVEIEKR
jgi:hypothetical protein